MNAHPKVLLPKYINLILVCISGVILTTTTVSLLILLTPIGFIFGTDRSGPLIMRYIGKYYAAFCNRALFFYSFVESGDLAYRNSETPPHALICNHLSFSDIPVLMDRVGTIFVMKRSLLLNPWGMLAIFFGAISIHRESLRDFHRVAKRAVKKIRGGQRILVFPEGTRSRDTEMLPFKEGMLHKFYKEKIPVKCVGIWGTQHSFVPGTLIIQLGMKFGLHYGQMIDPSDFSTFREFFDACRNEVILCRGRAIENLES